MLRSDSSDQYLRAGPTDKTIEFDLFGAHFVIRTAGLEMTDSCSLSTGACVWQYRP
jgi:3'-phosphoadenosine 5'-phosphosulfate (PAPS) 3'-phosphatase